MLIRPKNYDNVDQNDSINVLHLSTLLLSKNTERVQFTYCSFVRDKTFLN